MDPRMMQFTVEFSAEEVAAISHAIGKPADNDDLRQFAEDALNGALDEAKYAMERAMGEADEVDETTPKEETP